MTEDSYTHRPGGVEESRGGRESDDESRETPETEANADSAATDTATTDTAATGSTVTDTATDTAAPVERGRETWDRRDWLLVGVIVLCFLVVPATILYLPPFQPFRFAYLVLPLIPAILLGATAVWSAQRSN